jgi:hypothetical protein
MVSEWKRRAPCGTRHSLLTQQPTTTISRRGWKVCPQLPPATIFPDSEFLFSQEPLSKLLASDGRHGQGCSNCAAANALRVLENRTQGNWLSFFVQQHLISPAKVLYQQQRRGAILCRKNSRHTAQL